MELICPSCEARYQVPDASIGEKGRQVSCMSCGHSWHAFPPLILGSSAAPPTTAAPGIDYQTPPRPGRSSAAFTPTETEAAPPRPPEPPAEPTEPPRAADPSRSEQLAEIREMLAEVQSEERAAAALVPDDDYRASGAPATESSSHPAGASAPESQPATGAGSRPSSMALIEDEDEDDESDPLRRRMAMHDREHDKRRTDVERLRKRHERRTRQQQRARDAGSGAFLTGFLLIVMIGAAMTALYILQPQIVARMPGTGPMLAEYVETVDGLRVQVAEGYQSARDWLLDLIEKNA